MNGLDAPVTDDGGARRRRPRGRRIDLSVAGAADFCGPGGGGLVGGGGGGVCVCRQATDLFWFFGTVILVERVVKT